MKEQNLQAFPFKEIREKIEEKRDIYISLIKSNTTYLNQTEEEKESIANDLFTAELELYIQRLKVYYFECLEENKSKGSAMPTLSIFQGVNIFLEVLQTGLSFSETSNHIYLAQMIGSRGEVAWKYTADAVVFLCQRSGAISHISDVIIVSKNENFEVYNENGEFKVKHTITSMDGDFDYEKDFLCAYLYVIYPSGYRELRMVNRKQMDDAYKMSKRKSNYNMISMLKSKTVKRALRFDRKITIQNMVNTSSVIAPQNSKSFNVDISEVEETSEIKPAINNNSISTKLDTVDEVKVDPEVMEEKQEEETTDLLDGLDLNFG